MGTRSLAAILAVLSGACVLPVLPATAGAQPAPGNGGPGNMRMYLLLPGGDLSTLPETGPVNNADVIELTGFSLSAVAKTGPAYTGKSAVSALPTLDVTATMPITATTVGLLDHVGGSKAFTKLEVDFRRTTGASAPYTFVKYLFTSAALTSYSLQDGPGGDSVQIGLSFTKFTQTSYTKSSQTGAVTASAGTSWDLTTNKQS